MPNKDTIDERVVEMRIDNRQFVKGANNTISVLDKLKNALSFKDAVKGFNEIDKAANKVDLGGISSAVDTIADKFTVFGRMGQRVIENLTDSIYNFTKKTVQELTTDQIQAGWKKYEDITTSIHTIMGATANNWDQTLERISKDYGFVGSQMDFVSQQMEKLNWFTDETSASLTDMVNNIGKFTNAGVELDQATISMMGISTWGYKSGATVNEISRAMYNLSQAMALGEVRLMDWRSIENANMATIEFKQTVLDTAVEMGTLEEVADGLYKTLNGKDVSATNFNENLSEGWFTSDVLQATLYQYGHFANLVQQVTELTGVSTRDMLDMVEDYKNGTFDAVKWQNRLYQTMGTNTPSINALSTAMETLTDQEDELGWKAFLASQETKTLTEAIEYTKDAVSSGWMKTWQYVFGDYEEAKEFWSDVTDELYELFVKAGERRNAILSFWKDDGGRDALIEALWNVYDAVMNFVQPIKDAFKTIFGLDDDPKKAAKVILDLTYRFRDFTETLFVNEETLDGMRVVFTKLFSGIRTGLTYLQKAFSVLSKVFSYVTRIIGAFFRAFSSGTFDSNKFLGEMNDIFGDIIKNINKAWEKVKKFIEGMYDIPVLGPILKILVAIFEKIGDATQWVVGRLKDVKVTGEGLKGPFKVLNDIFEGIWSRIKNINIDSNKLSGIFTKISDVFSTIWEGLVGDPNEFKNKVKNMFKLLFETMSEEVKNIDFNKLMQGAKTGALIYIAAQFANIAASFKQATKSLKSIPEAISGVFSSIQDTFKALQKSINANTYIKIAIAIGVLAWAILQLSQIDDNKLVLIAAALVTMFALLAKAAKSLEKSNMFSGDKNSKIGVLVQNLSKTAQTLIGLAAIIAAAAYAMSQISDMSADQIKKGLIVIMLILGMSIAALFLLNKAVKDENGNIKSIIKLASFAAIMKAVGDAMVKLAGLNTQNVIEAAIAMGIVIAALALALSQASKIQSNALGMMGVIIALTIAIIALTLPLITLSAVAKNNVWGLITAAGIIGLLIAVMAAFLKIGAQIGDMPGFKKFATTLVILASAMLLFSIATAIMVPTIIALVTAFAGLIAVIMAMTDDQFSMMASRIAILGAALLPFAAVLLIAGAGLLMFGTGLLAAALAVGVFSLSMMGFAASIALIALAVNLFVNAVSKIIEVSTEYGDRFLQVLQGLLLAVLGLLVGYRLYIANATLTIILTILTVLVNVGGEKLIEAVHFLLLQVASFLFTIVADVADLVVGFIVYLFNMVTNSIQKNKEALIIAIERLIGTIISLILETAIRLLFDAVDMIFNWIASLFGAENNARFAEWGKNIADGVSQGVMEGFENTYRVSEAAGENTGGTLVQMAQEGAEAKAPDFAASLGNITSEGIGKADETVSSEAPTVGSNLIIGMNNGMIDEYYQTLQPNIGALGGTMVSDMMGALGEHSPSKFTTEMGKYWDLGLAFGVRDNADKITEANDDVAMQMKNALMSTMQIIGMIANDDMSIKPLIKPVVDLSDVSSASSMVSGMFGAYGSMDIGAINARVREAADNASSVASDVNAFGEATGSSGDSFVINVYSQPGMDENELANAVMYKIQNGIIRKGAALG